MTIRSARRNIWGDNPGQSYLLDSKWDQIRARLAAWEFAPARMLVLDIGCGDGKEVRRFETLGCRSHSIVCLDVLPRRVRDAKSAHPATPFLVGDGRRLPFATNQFDLVYQSVMTSSNLAVETRRSIAREMARVVRPGGLVLWYDMRFRNPFNPLTRPISQSELHCWFRGLACEIAPITLLPPLARSLAPLSIALCRLLERLPILRTHLLAIFRKAQFV
jgi:ubiquinone/menaquinone biosynthesis C-methylase UbiE